MKIRNIEGTNTWVPDDEDLADYRSDWKHQIELLKSEIADKQRQIDHWEEMLANDAGGCKDGECA